MPYLRNPTQPALRQFAFTEEFTGDERPRPNTNGHATVRDDRYKLIYRYSGGAREFFDLQNDPWENNNLLSGTLSAAEQANFNALLAEISRLRTPRARFEVYGAASCAGSAGAPSIGTVGTPRTGTSYQIELSGLSDTVFGALPLPLDLSAFGGGVGCVLRTSGESATTATTSLAGTASITIAVPSQLALVGQRLYHSWLIVDSGAPANALGIVTTDAAAAVIGL